MLGPTFVLGLASGSKTLNLVNQDSYSSEYYLRESLMSFRVFVRHTTARRGVSQYDRHNVEATITTFATLTTPETYTKAYFIVELLPGSGDVNLMDALADWAIASSNANLVKLNNWES